MGISFYNGWPDAVIIGLGLFIALCYLGVLVLTRLARMSRARNRSWQAFLSRFVPLFPMLGILGTIIGLMRTMAFLGSAGAGRLQGAIEQFGVAMSTTFWGVLCCVVLTVLDVMCGRQNGADQDAVA